MSRAGKPPAASEPATEIERSIFAALRRLQELPKPASAAPPPEPPTAASGGADPPLTQVRAEIEANRAPLEAAVIAASRIDTGSPPPRAVIQTSPGPAVAERSPRQRKPPFRSPTARLRRDRVRERPATPIIPAPPGSGLDGQPAAPEPPDVGVLELDRVLQLSSGPRGAAVVAGTTEQQPHLAGHPTVVRPSVAPATMTADPARPPRPPAGSTLARLVDALEQPAAVVSSASAHPASETALPPAGVRAATTAHATAAAGGSFASPADPQPQPIRNLPATIAAAPQRRRSRAPTALMVLCLIAALSVAVYGLLLHIDAEENRLIATAGSAPRLQAVRVPVPPLPRELAGRLPAPSVAATAHAQPPETPTPAPVPTPLPAAPEPAAATPSVAATVNDVALVYPTAPPVVPAPPPAAQPAPPPPAPPRLVVADVLAEPGGEVALPIWMRSGGRPRDLRVRLTGLPEGASLSEGRREGGKAVVPADRSEALRLAVPPTAAGSFRIGVQLVDAVSSAPLTVPRHLTVNIRPKPAPAAVQPTPPPPPAPAPAVAPPSAAPEDEGEIIRQGNELLRAGDLAAARSRYLKAAQSGSPEAAAALARTYDARELNTLLADQADSAKAIQWYGKAIEGGMRSMQQHVDRLRRPAGAGR